MPGRDRASNWRPAVEGALHVLTGIAEFRSVDRLSEALRLSKSRVQEMVDFCLRIGVLKQERGELIQIRTVKARGSRATIRGK